MQIESIFGQKAHMEMCFCFVQFEAFGAMLYRPALDFLNDGVLDLEVVSLFPLSDTFSVVGLTAKGRKKSKACIKIWNTMYVPILKDSDKTLIDEFASEADPLLKFALSRDRFENERKAGNFSKVLNYCPVIEELA